MNNIQGQLGGNLATTEVEAAVSRRSATDLNPQSDEAFLFQAEATGELPDQLMSRLKFNADGLLCAVVQDYQTQEVLMVAWMDAEALRRTLVSGRVTYWSRSRQEYWLKGATSGHFQYVKKIALDCDGDALLLQIEQVGAACHTGTTSCFEAGGRLPAKLT